MATILLCTGNAGKAKEMQAMLVDGMDTLTLYEAGLPNDLPETGSTLEENALQKAQFAFQHTGIPSISDDSGLEVNHLNHLPGVRSARYAGDTKDPDANMAKVLTDLEGVLDRSAAFRTVIAFVDASRSVIFEGKVVGRIAQRARGSNGFGYDPIFQPDGTHLTFAEMDAVTKNKMSHRGMAMQKLNKFLKETFFR